MKIKRIFILSILSLLILFVSAGCQTISQYYAPDGAEGVARYYAKRYNGKRTTSGEIYKSKKLTAAHPSLPLGTRVKVVNIDNNKSVIVKINDRCLEHEDVFIDLSREAARKIGMVKKGKANVQITVIE
jgi:rare lipoprotein A